MAIGSFQSHGTPTNADSTFFNLNLSNLTTHIAPNDFILTKGPGKGIRVSNDTLEDFVNLHWPNEGPLLEEAFN